MSTQWRVGPAGPIGLDYSAVWLVAGALRLDMDREIFTKIRALEAETLGQIRNRTR